ncbi:hypothetical protein WN944_016163 [Citrus x changshan-huyou]|uniref:Uncharacterized protein n=1 Tax=Citrus x changshan-huyou TaxID=2935761 RepID=A0AAP0QRR4_9ROSI
MRPLQLTRRRKKHVLDDVAITDWPEVVKHPDSPTSKRRGRKRQCCQWDPLPGKINN